MTTFGKLGSFGGYILGRPRAPGTPGALGIFLGLLFLAEFSAFIAASDDAFTNFAGPFVIFFGVINDESATSLDFLGDFIFFIVEDSDDAALGGRPRFFATELVSSIVIVQVQLKPGVQKKFAEMLQEGQRISNCIF